jgi:hypothetical protein
MGFATSIPITVTIIQDTGALVTQLESTFMISIMALGLTQASLFGIGSIIISMGSGFRTISIDARVPNR